LITQPAARVAVWSALALLALSACAGPETAGDDLEGWGGGGEEDEWNPAPIGSEGATSASASATGGESGAGSGTGSPGSGGCGPGEHFCGGLCAGNTPETGCWQSASCESCTPPAHATSTCTEEGACDFACADDYHLVDGQCRCALECCTSLDCTGDNICSGGTCGPPPCYSLDCLGTCLLSLQCGGICLGDTCTCFPCQ
jgi:hypothetical protein